ncbi:MAG: hypothetical protein ABR567_00165 [Myxococcales bacterium]|nr:hypothetical protein [Myxococcales bacterium]
MAKALALVFSLCLVSSCGGSSSSSSCPAAQTCVRATGGDACRPSCVIDGGTACANGDVCQTWAVCCSGTACTTALATVCCPATGC